MLDIQELADALKVNRSSMNKISNDIRFLESFLQKLNAPDSEMYLWAREEAEGRREDYIAFEDNRLVLKMGLSGCLFHKKPLIEYKIEIREKAHPYLQIFIQHITETLRDKND